VVRPGAGVDAPLFVDVFADREHAEGNEEQSDAGAHDQDLHPLKGQLAILLPQPEVQYAYSGNSGYMFPRADGILLGGTFEIGEWDPTPQPAAIARIVENHRRFFSAMRCPA